MQKTKLAMSVEPIECPPKWMDVNVEIHQIAGKNEITEEEEDFLLRVISHNGTWQMSVQDLPSSISPENACKLRATWGLLDHTGNKHIIHLQSIWREDHHSFGKFLGEVIKVKEMRYKNDELVTKNRFEDEEWYYPAFQIVSEIMCAGPGHKEFFERTPNGFEKAMKLSRKELSHYPIDDERLGKWIRSLWLTEEEIDHILQIKDE